MSAYNAEKYLSRRLDSVAGQSLGGWECIVVDDGSTDGTSAIADEYTEKDARFRVIHKPNSGLDLARMAGLDAARGRR